MGIGEVLFVVALAGGFLVPTAIFKQWRLFWVFAIFFCCFGVCEWVSVAQTGMSISQHYWALDEVNPFAGWVIISGMAIGWVALLLHFKMRKKRN